MPFLSPLAGDDADDYYYGHNDGHLAGGNTKKKDQGLLSCLHCFLPCSPGAVDPVPHRRLLSDDSGDNDDITTSDVTADLSRLRAQYSRLTSGPSLRPRDIPRLLSRPDSPPLATAALSWLGGDLLPSCILLSLLPAMFTSLPSHFRHALISAARRLHAREAALDGEVTEYQTTYALKLVSQKSKDGIAEKAAEEMCKMARAARRADKLRWRAVEVAAKEVLTPAQAREFLKAVEDVTDRVTRRGARWHASVGPVSVPVDAFARIRANARAATDAW